MERPRSPLEELAKFDACRDLVRAYDRYARSIELFSRGAAERSAKDPSPLDLESCERAVSDPAPTAATAELIAASESMLKLGPKLEELRKEQLAYYDDGAHLEDGGVRGGKLANEARALRRNELVEVTEDFVAARIEVLVEVLGVVVPESDPGYAEVLAVVDAGQNMAAAFHGHGPPFKPKRRARASVEAYSVAVRELFLKKKADSAYSEALIVAEDLAVLARKALSSRWSVGSGAEFRTGFTGPEWAPRKLYLNPKRQRFLEAVITAKSSTRPAAEETR